jgi:hypothetical protein
VARPHNPKQNNARFCCQLLLVAVAVGIVLSLSNSSVARAQTPTPATAPEGLTRLSEQGPVWLDAKHKRVVFVGEICQTEGPMEMFACLKKTKEHESIVAVDAQAYVVHAGLVAVGAEPGNPARFVPEYTPARGTEIAVRLYWTDAQGQRKSASAQSWLKNTHTRKPMEQQWVFAGSGFWVDPTTKQRHYQAEEGDFICVSNFATALLDVPVQSSQSNDALLFEANTPVIPAKGTRVTVALVPQLKGQPAERGDDPRLDLIPAAKKPEAESRQ